MATSTINLFKNVKFSKDKNFIVDSLPDYLATLTQTTITKAQYFRHELNTKIKLDISQVYQEYEATYNYNYMSIQNSNSSKVVYYFIVDKKQKAESTIEFILEMDVINTFKPSTDFTIDDKTLVIREHKDRIKRIDIGNIIPTKIFEKEITISEPYEVISYEGHDAIKFSYVVGMLSSQYQKEVEATQLGINTYTIYYEYDYTDSKFNIIVIGTLGDLAYFDYNIILNEYMPQEIRYYRNIDFYSENINPLLYKNDESVINQEINTSWNLIYINSANAYDPNTKAEVIDCYLLPDDNLEIDYTGSPSANLNGYSFTDLTYNIITADYNGEIIFEYGGQQYKVYNASELAFILLGNRYYNHVKYVVVFYDNGGTLDLYYYKYIYTYLGVYRREEIAHITNINSINILNCPENLYYYESTQAPNDWPPANSNSSKAFSADSYGNLLSIKQYDRTDSKLIKIIKLPYAPTYFSYDEITGRGKAGSEWKFNTNILKLQDLNTNFNYTFESDINPFTPLNKLTDTSFVTGRLRNDYFESKIYNSEFYYNKFVYDSFGFIFRLECINLEDFLKTYSSKFKINFVTTTTINSKFAFIFPDYTLKYSVEDYDNVLTISRNNEVSIYNSQYVNYLRTGYNYDLKQLERNKSLTGLNIASSIIGNATGTGIALATGSMATKISSVVGSVASITSSIINGIESIKSQEESIERRIAESRAQANSVSGSDDLDLMIAYSGNRAKLVNYALSERMKGSILDLFYYCGYSENSQKIPSLNTRLYFNYLECNLEFMEDSVKNIPLEIQEEIKKFYLGGVTFLHKVNGNWDFEQQLENFEVSLL